MITTRPAAPGGSRSKVALDHSSNNHEVASPSRNSEINYPTFVYVCVCVCVCMCVCAFVCLLALAAVSGVDLGRLIWEGWCVCLRVYALWYAQLCLSLKHIVLSRIMARWKFNKHILYRYCTLCDVFPSFSLSTSLSIISFAYLIVFYLLQLHEDLKYIYETDRQTNKQTGMAG